MMYHPCVRLLFGALGLASFVAGGHAQSPPGPAYRSFKDWVVGCDNTRACIAVGLPRYAPYDAGDETAFVQVAREGGGQASATVRLVLSYEVLTPIAIAVDGALVPGTASSRPVTYRDEGVDYSVVLLEERDVVPFVDAVRRGRRLRLTPGKREGNEVSLEGATAALLFMDDVQGRVGTTTALVRRGPKPAAAVPPSPPPPRVRTFKEPQGTASAAGFARIVRERLLREEPDACETPDPELNEADYAEPLGDDKVLVSIICNQNASPTGQTESLYYIVEGGNAAEARPADLPVPGDERFTGVKKNSLVGGSFDPATGLLEFVERDRPMIFDCGTIGKYAWTGGRFVLVSYRMMDNCRGVPSSFWPSLWHAEVE